MSTTNPRSLLSIVFITIALLFTTGVTAADRKHTVKTITVKKHRSAIAKKTVTEPVTVAEPVEVEVHAPAATVDQKKITLTGVGYGDTRVPAVAKHSDRDLQCLAKNIYFEAGSEPRAGKVAVAQVTINRVRSGRFADSICSVVYQKNQFSWVREVRRGFKLNDSRWAESLDVALAVLNGDEALASMEHALYFHNTSVRPAWGKPRIGRIGNHIFYRDRQPIINDDI